MTTKHIPDEIWTLVTKKTMEAIKLTKKPIKEKDVLKLLILKGLSAVTEEELETLGR